MSSLSVITKGLLAAHNLRPKKRLGQNFLVDQGALGRIVAAAGLSKDDTVLEIGTGLGVLTEALAARAGKVVTLDPDKDMLLIAKDVLRNNHNIEYVAASFLDWKIPEGFTKVVANVPYYITTPIIEKLLYGCATGIVKRQTCDVSSRATVRRIVLTVQKEVAERITSQPGTKKYGSFTIFVQNRAEVSITSHISRRSFYPPPNVDSSILVLAPREKLLYDINEELVRAAFSQRRKMVKSTLKKYNIDFAQVGIDPRRRAETLSLAEFEKLSKTVYGCAARNV